MTVDIKKLKEFIGKLEWEGSYENIIDYGIDGGTGDSKMDYLLENLEAALEACRKRERELWAEYSTQLEVEFDDV